MPRPISEIVEEQAKAWSGVTPPNAAAVRLAQGFEASIAGFEALRGALRFEDEPSSFVAALQETKEAM